MKQFVTNSIQRKLTAVIAGLLLLTIVCLSLVSYVFARNTLRREINERLSVVASDRQKLVLGFIELQKDRVQSIASRLLLRELLGTLADGQTPSPALLESQATSLHDAQRLVPHVRAIWIADLTGQVILSTDAERTHRNEATRVEFKEGLSQAGFFLQRDQHRRDYIVLSAPARYPKDRVVGVVFLLVDVAPFQALLADRQGISETGEVKLGARDGDKIALILSGERRDDLEIDPAQSPAMAAAIDGKTGFMATHDRNGTEVLAAYRPVGYRDWGIVSKIDADEAYAPIASLRNMFVAVEIFIFVVGFAASYWLANRVTRPVLRMVTAADAVAAGQFNSHVLVTGDDELGRLGQAFNHMTTELAQSYAALEDRVAARTQELQAERDLLQGLMDNTPDFIYFKDRESKFVRVNRAKAKKVGATDPAQLAGQTDFDHYPKDEAQRRYDDEQRIIAIGQPMIAYEESATGPDGAVTWLSSTKVPWRDVQGKIIGTFGISRDITERKRAQEELNRYFELSPDLFCIADLEGRFIRVSPAWTRVLGYEEAELLRRPFLEFVHPDDREVTIAQYNRNLHGQPAVQFENRYRCRDGSYLWLQWNSVTLPDQKLIHAVARDVSEHKRAQELLERFTDTLNRRNLEMQEDLKMAREVHQVFVPQHYPSFPARVPAERSALRFAHRYLPTSTLGGDFFDILTVSDTEAGILVCDVMGHGMRAALVTSLLRGMVDKYRHLAGDPGQFLGQINQALIENLKTVSATIFATACYVVVDVKTGRVRLANAGHPAPLLLRPAARLVERLARAESSHPPALGLLPETVYPTMHSILNAHDRLVFFTDGLYEVDGRDGQQFGVEQLEETVRQRLQTGNLELLDELIVKTRMFSAAGDFNDDVCLVGVEFLGPTG